MYVLSSYAQIHIERDGAYIMYLIHLLIGSSRKYNTILRKEEKGTYYKRRHKTFIDNIIVNIEIPEESVHQLLELIRG